ncbi:MAG: hypothetical protein R3300_05350 [Candidatus Promineifilaceae bacterium]|nr:hypothetical protein [Candidatus Promineifilaceae bacterium]
MKKLLIVSLIVVLLAAFAVPAFAAGPGDCDYGGVHSSFGKDGVTGNRGGVEGHIPGSHYGAAGFCGVGNPGGGG